MATKKKHKPGTTKSTAKRKDAGHELSVVKTIAKATPAPTPASKRVSGDDVVAADVVAGRALRAVEPDAASQLTALRALGKLVDTCHAAAPDGVLFREARKLLDERTAAFRAFQLENVERVVAQRALHGDVERERAIAAIENAIALVSVVDGGESGDVRTLRARLDDVRRGRPGKPRPFFARYLEHQKR